MKKLLIFALLLNATLLAGRLWQDMPANAQVGGGDPACEQDRTLHSIDSNGDGNVELSDAVHLLTWLFSGGPEPQVCLAQTSLKARVAALEAVLTEEPQEILSHMSIVEIPVRTDGGGEIVETAKTIRFTGVNVQIVNGLGATNGIPGDPNSVDPAQTTTNALGNLIVGYNELRSRGDDRRGSHNIVVGVQNNYSSFGGLVAGELNTISAVFSSVSGGVGNTATGDYSAVSGGGANTASGLACSVSGGFRNTASGPFSAVSGGGTNTASGDFSTVSGGGGFEKLQGNTAEGRLSTVSGARSVTVQDEAGHAP